MHDVIQQGLQQIGYGGGFGRALAVFCADLLIYVLGVAWLAVVARHYAGLTFATIARLAVLAVVAYAASTVLGTLIVDPRPYILEHIRPVTPIARDNGFPSDHTLLAALLTASLCWIDRRFIGLFAAAAVLIMAGRLAIAAHHTLDVLGTVLIVGATLLLAAVLPLPARLQRPILPRRSTKVASPTV